MNLRTLFFGALLGAAGPLTAAESAKFVEVRGDVARPGPQAVTPDTRLADILRGARVDTEGYWLGAAWLQPTRVAEQKRLKAGILFDLGLLQQKALLDARPELAALAERLRGQVAGQPVSGRRIHLLDPLAVEVTPEQNSRVQPGDVFVFPTRPKRVRVTGAVRADCDLDYQPLRSARDYASACAQGTEADPDYLYVIQPDGQVSHPGIALWNREDGQPAAPGATILVPLRDAGAYPQLNEEMAAFLATRVPSEVTP
ncbi:capsule biosynthesis GfcC family protein [Pseudomonas citronellolis]|uniref:capsule biosynthesis GfcC family protein n=1 Tax=Pseudomonas citronellolis TaxID=53408 RepID=UPI0023E3A708|nr:capsule biosynthesis GfcC family protein [Pseudomonas citronellolis]MDF3932271.1 capsule biosynthesis GfcC family protein [Pseudomonas citronellolis]